MSPYLILAAMFAFAAAAQPGQFQAYIVSEAIAHGWRKTLPATLAPVLSDVPIICLVVVVLTHAPMALIRWLQLSGGCTCCTSHGGP